ncbi:alanine dehydrogenase [Thiohalobacter sp. COW1]|uniref:alanine dehydrogenase n=1 Tax=Thiohalobacter sp. COW1 TaxID=2795687 RepID=UPI001916A90A|nr:alanine dehydrogenase [Thiohalobacter sp. COW1]BCO30571.1 alanine dehydrogenase [Thiohalobacter sp. COW1]
MRIGIPKEIKTLEGRVGLIPAACADLVQAGHAVAVEAGAGLQSGYTDDEFRAAGVEVLPDAEAVYSHGELIIKVKEPVAGDLEHLRADHLLFCYLHLAAEVQLARQLQAIGLTAIGFETVTRAGGLPLLAPMSDIAGRLAVQIGATLLHTPQGGKGMLLGGLPAAERGRVTVIGGGFAGGNAAAFAAAMGAEVTVFDKKRERLEAMRELGPNVTALYPYQDAVAEAVAASDLLIGAVLIPGARAPHVVPASMVERMAPGGAVVDISVDQGGCIETIHPTDYSAPTYDWNGIVHFGVTNMPGAVPRSASQALSAAVLPYALLLAGEQNWTTAPGLAAGINIHAGDVVHPAVKAALGGKH